MNEAVRIPSTAELLEISDELLFDWLAGLLVVAGAYEWVRENEAEITERLDSLDLRYDDLRRLLEFLIVRTEMRIELAWVLEELA